MMMSQQYFNALKKILDRIESEQTPVICEAGKLVSTSLARGGILHTFGSGHSHMISEEAFFRAGGLVPVNAILDKRLLFLNGAAESTTGERESGYARTLIDREDIQPIDIAIVISNSGRNAVPIEVTQEIQARGVKVIAITNVIQSTRSSSRHSSGKRLFELADLTIDNCIPEGDTALEVPGSSQRIGPTSTIACAAIINAVIVEAIANLRAVGITIPVFPSANIESASDKALEALLAQWAPRIPLFRKQSALTT